MLKPPSSKQFRPVRVAVAVVAGFAVFLASTALAFPFWHQYQIWAHDGVWCVQANAEGKVQTLYGSDCQQQK